MDDKDPLNNDDCSSKFFLPRALLYPILALLVAGAILIFAD